MPLCRGHICHISWKQIILWVLVDALCRSIGSLLQYEAIEVTILALDVIGVSSLQLDQLVLSLYQLSIVSFDLNAGANSSTCRNHADCRPEDDEEHGPAGDRRSIIVVPIIWIYYTAISILDGFDEKALV